MQARVLVVVIGAAIGAGMVRAQGEPGSSFEVASIRPSASSSQMSQSITNARVDLVKNAMRQMLWMAFQIDPVCCRDRLSAPEWVDRVSFDVHATIPNGRTRQQVPDMLKSLLVQRFGLRFHVDERPTDIYELVVGNAGIRMKEVQASDELAKEFPAQPLAKTVASDRTDETVNGRIRTIQIPFGVRTITERTMYDQAFIGGTQRLDAARMTMPELASVLAQNTGRPVVDKTNLTGVYTFNIQLPPNNYIVQGSASIGRPLNEPTGVSATRAVEQLGLKLEPRRAPVSTIIVDRLERVPSDN